MLDFSRFEILTFDCYGTLINWEQGILQSIHRILAAHGKDSDDATILQLYGDFEASAEQGVYRSYREVLQSVVGHFGEHFGFAPTNDEIRSLPESIPNWKPWPDTRDALRSLHERFRLAIISNVDDDLFARTQPQLGVKFDQIITAQQAKAYKPSLKIFHLALSRVGVPAHRILHIGQSIYHDVIPAKSLGLATVWVNRPSPRTGVGAVKAAQGHPDLQVSGLAEIVSFAAGQPL
ncbi:MAG: haloacid dehalogenase, type [Candidatus Sulfotelmatobacter sp.]|nr:haloacid dehalogenase, type [Candidatus Sulfotelmatobacter sp.]